MNTKARLKKDVAKLVRSLRHAQFPIDFDPNLNVRLQEKAADMLERLAKLV